VPVTRCGRPLAVGHQFTHPGGRPAPLLASPAQVGDHLDGEAEFLAELAQGVHITGVAVAEPGVAADHDLLGPERVHQDLLDEPARAPQGQLVGERHHQHGVQPGGP
jgi:hypothetical protein